MALTVAEFLGGWGSVVQCRRSDRNCGEVCEFGGLVDRPTERPAGGLSRQEFILTPSWNLNLMLIVQEITFKRLEHPVLHSYEDGYHIAVEFTPLQSLP
jgi:hypothetical protein